MDLVLGRFADEHIDQLSDDQLTVYETLMEVPDRDLLKWVTNEAPVPANYDTEVFQRVKSFHMRPDDYLLPETKAPDAGR